MPETLLGKIGSRAAYSAGSWSLAFTGITHGIDASDGVLTAHPVKDIDLGQILHLQYRFPGSHVRKSAYHAPKMWNHRIRQAQLGNFVAGTTPQADHEVTRRKPVAIKDVDDMLV